MASGQGPGSNADGRRVPSSATTVRGGLERNYRMIVVSNAVAHMNGENHYAERKIFGQVTNAASQYIYGTISHVEDWRSGTKGNWVQVARSRRERVRHFGWENPCCGRMYRA
jgi:hypothetical protein